MTTARQLWLGFGTLTALLVLAVVAILLRVRSIEETVHDQADVARPRSNSTRQLEINVLGFALGVHEHLYAGAPATKTDEAAADVERELAEYRRLAMTDRQRELATRFGAGWQEMQALGHTLLSAENRAPKQDDVARFHELRVGMERFLNDEMQPEAIATYDDRRDATFEHVRTIVGFAFVLLVVGTVVAVVTSGVVGKGIVSGEQALRQAHDELEDRVRARTAELGASNEALRRSNQELEQFASVASHDLQEPLRKIQAFGDRLQAKCGDGLGEAGHEYLERILTSAARMRNLIDDLLSFSRVATKAQPFVPTNLTTLAREAVSDLEGRIHETGGRVDVGEVPTLDADPLQMRQLLQNLIANGLKFHRPGVPPVVRVRGRLLPTDSQGLEDDGAPSPLCEIVVDDNGIGFEETYRDRIFEVFQRLHGRNEYEGTGMGLAICRKIVERHGGHITARSTPGQGATFLVTLPVQQPREENAG